MNPVTSLAVGAVAGFTGAYLLLKNKVGRNKSLHDLHLVCCAHK